MSGYGRTNSSGRHKDGDSQHAQVCLDDRSMRASPEM